MASIEVLQIGGWVGTLPVKDGGDDDYKASLVAGIGVQVDTDGSVIPCTDALKLEGFLVNDYDNDICVNVSAEAFEGALAVLTGGGLFITDNVKEDNIVPGDLLYIGDGGVLTKTENGSAVAIAHTANSTADKNIVVRF